ncbi:unnamed protein product [Blepharisma stoltei]|uniref:GAF domain-containing protein n=1 Tax=Blepharisma stoltei TaxID=1481888 RepID=A0AAU9JHK0_9CILI|nr:unnamed protein product [Blepharisma stoltei]
MNKNLTGKSPLKSRYRPKSLSPIITPSHEYSFSSRSDMNAYVMPKIKNYELITTEATSPRNQVENKFSLIQQISQLERQHRADKVRIELLEKQVKDLEQQIENHKKLNKNFLEEKGATNGDVHALYHDLFITDLKQQMTEMNGEMETYKKQIDAAKKEAEIVKKENSQLCATLKRYRRMLSEAIQKPENSEIPDSSSVMSMMPTEKSSHKSILDQRHLNVTLDASKVTLNGLKNNLVSLGKLDRLSHAMAQLSKCEDLMQICKGLIRSTKSLIKCEKATIFIANSKAKDEYTKSFGQSSDFIGRARVGNNWILVHTHPNANQEDPIFKKLEELKFSIRNQDSLAAPVRVGKDLFLVIQCQDKHTTKNTKKIFSPVDEILVKSLAILVSLQIDRIIAKSQENLEQKHARQTAGLAAKISSSLTHKDIANRVRSVFPSYFDFECAGIVFVDNYLKELFTMCHDPNNDEYYGDQVLRFPYNMGITGEVIERGDISVIENPKMNFSYNPELDNVGGAQEAKNILMGCIKNWNGKIIAVIQLINKKGGFITDKDTKRLESLMEMIAASVTSAIISIEQFDLTIKAKKIIEAILHAVQDSDLVRTDGETAIMFNQIMSLKNQFSEWAKSKKPNKK